METKSQNLLIKIYVIYKTSKLSNIISLDLQWKISALIVT